ncbi:symporter small accessory protein [Massilibacteroides sp.]
MFGIDDPGIWLAYLLAFACLVFSVIYGIVNWNKDDEKENSQRNQ